MAELGAQYLVYRKNAERQELDRFMEEQARLEETATPPPRPAASAAVPKKESPSALKAGGKAGVEAAATGVDRLLRGTWNLLLSGEPHPSDVGRGTMVEVASGLAGKAAAVKDVVDGLFEIILSPGIGAGAAIQQFMKNVTPGAEQTPVLAGGAGGPSQLARAAAGMPVFKAGMTAEEKAAAQAPMTLGELTNIATILATPVGIHKVFGGKTPPTPAPAPAPAVEAPKKMLALRSAPIEAKRSTVDVTLAERIAAGVRSPETEALVRERASARIAEASTVPTEKPTVVGPGAQRAELLGLPEREQLRALERTPLSEPTRGVAEPAAAPGAAPEGPLGSALDVALQKAEQAIKEGLREEKPAPTPTPEGGEILSAGLDPTRVPLLARAAIGGLLGGATGDTPEERIRNAFLGMGIGAVLSRTMAQRTAEALKDQSGALFFAKRPRVDPLREPYQPNYNRIKAEADVKRLMKNVYRTFKEPIVEQQRGVRTHAETEAAALDLIRSGKVTPERILGLEPGAIATAEELVAFRKVEVQAATQALEIAEAVTRGDPVNPGEIRQAIAFSGAISRNVRAVKTEAARATEAGRITVGAETVGPLKVDPARIADMADQIARGASDAEVAGMVMALKTPEKVAAAARFWSVMPRAILEVMYFSMLSGKSVIRNLVGNTLVIPLSIADRAVAPYMPRWGSRLPGVLPGEAHQMLIGWHEGLIEQVRMLRHLDEFAAQAEKMGTRKIEGRYAPAITAENFGATGPAGWAIDWLGRVVRTTMDIMNGTDAAGKAINGRMQHRVEALRQATAEGTSGDALWTRFDELMEKPEQLTGTARDRIQDFAERQTFTKDLEGRVLSALSAGPQNPWLNTLYRLSILPFFRTPVRIAEYSSVHTPGLNLLASQFWGDIKAGGTQRQLAQAKLATGGAIIGSFTYLAAQGLITGTAPRDPVLRAGSPPEKSWWDPVSEKWRSYDGFEPLSTLVSTAADLARYLTELPEADGLQLFMAAALSQVNNLESKNYMMGISDFFDVMTAPGPDAQVERALKFIRQRLSAFAPAFLREIEGGVDPTKRRVMPSGEYDNPLVREFQALKDQYRQQIPGLSDAKDEQGNFLVPPHRDLLTGVPEASESLPFNIVGGKSPKDDPVWQEVRRLRGAHLREVPEWIGGERPGADVGLSPEEKFPGVRLTPQERDRWLVLMTQELKNPNDETMHQELARVISSDEYKKLSDGLEGGKASVIQRTVTRYRERAGRQLLEESPLLKAEVNRRQMGRRMQRLTPETQETFRDLLGPGLTIGR